jgi:hypothetical protein
MQETENYHLKQIENDDKPSEYPSVQSENMQVIDEQMHELATEVTPIARGGTGASTAAKARTNLDVYSKSEVDTALGNFITTKSTAGHAYGPLLSVTAEGHAEQDKTTGKNLLPIGTSETNNGVTYTVNPDGTVLANGTATGLSILAIALSIQPGTYTLSGCPSGGTDNTYRQDLYTDESSGISLANEYGNGKTFTVNETLPNAKFRIRIPSGATVNNLIFYPQLEAGSTATEYEPYTGGKPSPNPDYPQEIKVVRGRNLIDLLGTTAQKNNGADLVDGVITMPPFSSGNQYYTIPFTTLTGEYTVSFDIWASANDTVIRMDGQPDVAQRSGLGADKTITVTTQRQRRTFSGNLSSGLTAWRFFRVVADASSSNATVFIENLQFEKGSTAHPYVPYGHVGLDVTANGKTTTTPIPLPSRGWVGSLPDGTHDALAIDGAGKVTWEKSTEEVMLDGSEGWSLYNNGTSVGTPVIDSLVKPNTSNTTKSNLLSSHFAALTPNRVWAGDAGASIGIQNSTSTLRMADGTGAMTVEAWKTWLQANPVTVLYPLTTPTTEDMGYIDLPDIPEGAVVSMPELEGLGVESWTSDAVARYVRAWAARS